MYPDPKVAGHKEDKLEFRGCAWPWMEREEIYGVASASSHVFLAETRISSERIPGTIKGWKNLAHA